MRLQKQFGSECLSRAAVFKWAKAFKDGRIIVDCEPASHQKTCTVTGRACVDFLRTQRTINAVYYSNLLKTLVKPAYLSKRRSIPARSAILLQDNARLTLDIISKLGWKVLEHPPYSPDLSPCDYHMFGPLKETLGGQKFNTDDEIEGFVRTWLSELPKEFFDILYYKINDLQSL